MTEKPLKFIHLANHRHENLFDVPIMIGGFYNWHKAMGGEFSLFKAKEGRLKNYDVLFIGLSRPELIGQVATRMRREIGRDSKTKIVVCIDYAVELWANGPNVTFEPYALECEIENADLVFISEPTMISHIKALMKNDKIPIYHIPHPSDIKAISQLASPIEMRSNDIVCLIHRYDNNWLDPFLVIKDLPWESYALTLDQGIAPLLYPYFNYVVPGQEFIRYMQWLSTKKIVLDSYHRIHTYGRTPVDCACLGVPIVGTTLQWAQKFLWPEITVEPGDVYGQKQLIKKLMTDEGFYSKVIEYAKEKVDYFSYENRKQHLLKALRGELNG